MEILNKIPIYNPNNILCMVLVVFIFIGFILGILGLIFLSAPFGSIRDKISTWFVFGGMFIMVSSWITFVCAVHYSKGEPMGRYKYEVKINDSTTFKEVTDNYKIVDNRGEIWILEDKED